MEENWKARVHLAAAYRALEECGLNEGINNHLSARAPAENGRGEVILMLPFGYAWKEATPSLLVGIDKDNVVVEAGAKGGMPERTAIAIHTAVYESRPDINCVMHTHQSHTTALGCLKDPTLRMIHQNSARFWNRVGYDEQYSGLVQAADEGKRIAGLLGSDKNVLLLCHHGCLVAAKSTAVAFDLTYYLERACHVQILAMSTGQEIKELPEEMVEFTHRQLWNDMENGQYSLKHLEAFRRKYATTILNFNYKGLHFE